MIYLDNAATTKPYPEVIKAMNEAMSIYWANPSSNNSMADAVLFVKSALLNNVFFYE